jgi:hypothetical protein
MCRCNADGTKTGLRGTFEATVGNRTVQRNETKEAERLWYLILDNVRDCGLVELGTACQAARMESMDFAERAARNEEVFRNVNESIEAGAEQHDVVGALPFHCECARVSCLATIEIPPGRYAAIVSERYRFVVVPGHEQAAIEEIVETTPDYLVVEKVGEAREQIDRDHPQERHRR